MRQTILQFLEKSAAALTKSDRAVLETLLVLTATSDTVSTTMDALRDELARRQGQPISIDTYRQRIKRLNDNLTTAKSPFRLASSGGAVTAAPTLESDKDIQTGAWLAEHSRETTLQAPVNAVPPLARPENPLVMFSYAHLDGDAHDYQIQFFHALDRVLGYPPPGRPKIKLWRDERDIRKAGDPGQYQMDAACREAFLGLILMSDKYPHSEYCGREAAHFIDDDGENCSGKVSLIVPVNVRTDHAPARFHKRVRVWQFAPGGKTLLQLWSEGNAAEKDAFVRNVAAEIWQAAVAATGDPAVHRVEHFALCRDLEHKRATIVPPLGCEGRLDRALSDGEPAEPVKASRVEIVDHLAKWAAGTDGPRLVALLGDFGMGKTVSCQLLTQELLGQYQDDPSVPLPVYFDLRNIDRPETAGSTSLEELIDQMLRRPGERPPAAREIINYVRERDALIIFDGLDEVTNKLPTDQAIRLYRELLSVIPAETWRADLARKPSRASTTRGPRLLVSCRTHYFRDIAAQRAFLAGQNREYLSPEDDIKIFYLLPFDDEQIEKYLGLHLEGAEVEHALALIKDTYNLQELAARPIFLTFIRQTLDRIEADARAGRTINIARLYDSFVENSLERDDPKHLIPVREKRELLADLALMMHKRRRDALSNNALDDWFDKAAARLPKLQRALEGTEGVSAAGRFLQDLRNASFLVRPGDEAFRFAHTSVREYFLANAVHKVIREGHGDTLDMAPLSKETMKFILARQAVADTDDQRAFLEYFPTLLKPRRAAAVRSLAFDVWLTSDTRLPRPPQLDLSGLDFSRRVFHGTEARPLPLSRTIWRGTKLRQTEFDYVDLEDADFNGSIAPLSVWVGCRVPGAKWLGADLTGSRWRYCRLDDGAVAGAALQDAELIFCSLGAAEWTMQKITKGEQWEVVRRQHYGWVRSVALGRVSERCVVAWGAPDGTVWLVDATSGHVLSVLGGYNGRIFSIKLDQLDGRDVVLMGGDEGVQIADAVTGRRIVAMDVGNYVFSLALGHVGGREVLVFGSDRYPSHSGDHSAVYIADAFAGKNLAVFEDCGDRVWAVALGTVGNRDVVIYGGKDHSVRVTDVTNGELITALQGQSGNVHAIASGKVLGRDVVVWGGECGNLQLVDAATGASLCLFENHQGRILSVALGRITKREVVVSGGGDGAVRIADAASGQSIVTLEGHHSDVWCVVLGQNGDREVVVSAGHDSQVRIRDAVSFENLATFNGYGNALTAVAFGQVGERCVIISADEDENVRIIEAKSGNRLCEFIGYGGWINSIALDHIGGREVAILGGHHGSLCLIDIASKRKRIVRKGRGDWVPSVWVGRLGRRKAVALSEDDGSLRILNATNGRLIASLEGDGGQIASVALGRFSHQDVVVTGYWDGELRIRDAVSGKLINILAGHNKWVRAVALGRVGNRDVVISGDSDGDIRFWDVSGRCFQLLRFSSLSKFRSIAVGSCDGYSMLATGGEDGTIRLIDIDGLFDVAPYAFVPQRQRILGPGPDTLLDLVPDGAGDYRITHASPDAWRYYIAQGRTPEGRLVTAPIETMFAKEHHGNGGEWAFRSGNAPGRIA